MLVVTSFLSFGAERQGVMIRGIVLVVALAALESMGVVDGRFVAALAFKETGNRSGIVGDRHLKEHSYGKWQIRRVYLEDVKRLCGKELAKAGYPDPSLEDVRKDDRLGRIVVELYLGHYGRAYERATGRRMTPAVAFMIHNGGPRGWDPRVRHHAAARSYAESAMRIYAKI